MSAFITSRLPTLHIQNILCLPSTDQRLTAVSLHRPFPSFSSGPSRRLRRSGQRRCTCVVRGRQSSPCWQSLSCLPQQLAIFTYGKYANHHQKLHPTFPRAQSLGGGGSGGPDPQKYGWTTPTFLMKSVITVT